MRCWPQERLGAILSEYKEFIDRPKEQPYVKLSVKLYGKGVVLDPPVDGSTLKMRKHQLARAGQVILSEIWGKKGAIGLVPPEGDRALCTSHFFLFDINHDRVLPGWLAAIFRANYLEKQLAGGAFGTTGYAAVRPQTLLSAQIPLPPIAEQRRVVARIEEFRTKVDEARGLSKAAAAHAEALCRSFLSSPEKERWPRTPMRDVVALREPDTVVSPSEEYPFAGVFCFGRGVFKAGRKMGATFGYRVLTRIRCGNFVYPKLMAWEGALGVVPQECDGLFVSPEFPVFEVDTSTVLPETLDVFFRTPSVWPRLAVASTGTNVRRRRLHPRAFLAFEIPLPPMDVQLRLRATRFKLQEAAALRGSGGETLDALMPAILRKAFRGEL